eukprot:9491170-Pyramimonas_sp.AAC.1
MTTSKFAAAVAAAALAAGATSAASFQALDGIFQDRIEAHVRTHLTPSIRSPPTDSTSTHVPTPTPHWLQAVEDFQHTFGHSSDPSDPRGPLPPPSPAGRLV